MRAPRAAPMLTGFGGAAPADLGALADVALRLSRLADDLPGVVELQLGAVAAAPGNLLWAAIRVGPPIRNEGPRAAPASTAAPLRFVVPRPVRWVSATTNRFRWAACVASDG